MEKTALAVLGAGVNQQLYDVFVCHASEDKEGFVRPLAKALQKQNVEVWYDEFSLKIGDSIRRAIDRGLRSSRYGIVVLSQAFFQKNWPQYELDGLVEREVSGGESLVLPIWHGVDHTSVLGYSPALAAKKAVSSSLSLHEIVGELVTQPGVFGLGVNTPHWVPNEPVPGQQTADSWMLSKELRKKVSDYTGRRP